MNAQTSNFLSPCWNWGEDHVQALHVIAIPHAFPIDTWISWMLMRLQNVTRYPNKSQPHKIPHGLMSWWRGSSKQKRTRIQNVPRNDELLDLVSCAGFFLHCYCQRPTDQLVRTTMCDCKYISSIVSHTVGTNNAVCSCCSRSSHHLYGPFPWQMSSTGSGKHAYAVHSPSLTFQYQYLYAWWANW